jgi:RimJ/RimL family protein N-acetyltransferase
MKRVLETPRLLVREMGMDDLAFLSVLLADPPVMRYWPHCLSRAETVAWIRRQQERYEHDGHGYWLVVEQATGQPIGQAGVLTIVVDGVEETGLGYMIHHPFWRRGFATEVAAASRDFAFDRLGTARVIAPIRPENGPSIRVAEKLGMREEQRTVFAGLEHVIFAVYAPRRG